MTPTEQVGQQVTEEAKAPLVADEVVTPLGANMEVSHVHLLIRRCRWQRLPSFLVTRLFALESLQFQPSAHFAVGGGAFHVHGFHESAIVVDVHLESGHSRGDFAFAACAYVSHHFFALVAHLWRDEYIGDDVDIFDFGIAEYE